MTIIQFRTHIGSLYLAGPNAGTVMRETKNGRTYRRIKLSGATVVSEQQAANLGLGPLEMTRIMIDHHNAKTIELKPNMAQARPQAP